MEEESCVNWISGSDKWLIIWNGSQIQQSIKGSQPNESQDLSSWVNELINARQNLDEVRVADMLEYEVIPRLPQ